jgi:dolichyl-phosphate beta-glucosyltransferase
MNYPSLSLIIPCFNESSRVAQMMEGIKEFLSVWHGDFEFIIVDDGSTDDTVTVIKNNILFQNLLADDKIKIILQANIGKGGALKNGIINSKLDYILTLDADMATHPAEIIHWARNNKKVFDETTISIASRTMPTSKLVLISNRRESGKLFNTLVRTITGLRFRDTQCGFKLYPAAIAKQLFASLHTLGWAHDVEILMNATKQKIEIQDLPITWNEQAASKINVLQDGFVMLLQVCKMKLRFIFSK